MSTTRRLVSLGIGAAVAMLINGAALAVPLPGADQKCIDGYNNFLRLVSAQAGKSATSCIKNASKGKEPNPDNCIVANTDGKIAGKRSKVSSLFGSKCTGSEPIQTGATNGNDAHQDALEDLAHDYFGDPVSGVVSVGKQSQKCLQKAIQRPTQAFTELVKAHRKCKKNEMKAGNVVDSATLDTFCGTFALIDGANGGGGKVAGKYSKATTDVTAACAGTEETLASLFSGLDAGCHASPAALAACLNAGSKCRACLALNDADGQDMDCDTMDDGAANGSCGGYPAVNIGTHACTLNGAGSSIALTTEAFPIPPFSATGALSIACGTTAPDGTAACDCTVTNLDPVVIPAIGDVCVNPAAGCPSGQIDCDGGAKQDVNLVSDHTIGACASNAACDTACDATCAAIAPAGSHVQLLSGCEGRCQGGAMDEAACTSDTQCTGGQCVGAEPVNGAHVGLCNCTCGGTGLGAPSLPGSLSCSVGTQIDVELPSDNDCLDPNTIVLPPLCGPVTTTTSSGQLINVNNGPNNTPAGGPQTATGVNANCAAMPGSTVTGVKLVGQLGFFDSTLGDLLSLNTFTCQ